MVWSLAFLASARKYGDAAVKWVSKSVTDSVELEPTFEHLEWKDLKREAKTGVNNDDNNHELISSAGYTPFFFQGIVFILHEPESSNGNDAKTTLRCLWGSSRPIDALLKEVRRGAKSDNKQLSVTYISSGQNRVHKCRKRLLSTVYLDPQSKQELLSDLQEFLDEDTEDYYYQNGTPYRRGYLFYGPLGTGKTSLSTAIASHYDLPVCVIGLAGMTDTVLQNKFQSLPTRCVIFFEDIDGYRRCRYCQKASTAPV
jgi:chaperone BCS1